MQDRDAERAEKTLKVFEEGPDDEQQPEVSPVFDTTTDAMALKAGWKTTEFALLGAVSAALGLATVFNWLPADKAATVSGHLTTLLNNIGPLIPVILLCYHFITSRGKLKSNALKAQAATANPAAALGLFGSGKLDKILAGVRAGAGVVSEVAPDSKAGKVASKVVFASTVLEALGRLVPAAAGGEEMVQALKVVVPALNPAQGMSVLEAITLYGPVKFK
jgi:hypothetical protein